MTTDILTPDVWVFRGEIIKPNGKVFSREIASGSKRWVERCAATFHEQHPDPQHLDPLACNTTSNIIEIDLGGSTRDLGSVS